MSPRALREVAANMGKALTALKRQGWEDSRITERYAEYWVAGELGRRGGKVQILDERAVSSADVYLPEADLRIEVKSCLQREDGFAYASFARGKLPAKH